VQKIKRLEALKVRLGRRTIANRLEAEKNELEARVKIIRRKKKIVRDKKFELRMQKLTLELNKAKTEKRNQVVKRPEIVQKVSFEEEKVQRALETKWIRY